MEKDTNKGCPVSPRSGAPLPRGRPFQPGIEAREKGRNGGKRSAEIRAARKTLRNELLDLLCVTVKAKNGEEQSAQELMSSALIKQAIRGNTKAFEIIRDTIGEKPIESVKVTTSDYSALDDAFSTMAGDGD
jgi:hypothetical protein